MDLTDILSKQAKATNDTLGEDLTMPSYQPSSIQRAKKRITWLIKQANQRQKTLELDGASHSRDYKNRLRAEKQGFLEEAKRLMDAVEDGEIK